jgi:hypothetical protein
MNSKTWPTGRAPQNSRRSRQLQRRVPEERIRAAIEDAKRRNPKNGRDILNPYQIKSGSGKLVMVSLLSISRKLRCSSSEIYRVLASRG